MALCVVFVLAWRAGVYGSPRRWIARGETLIDDLIDAFLVRVGTHLLLIADFPLFVWLALVLHSHLR